MKERALQMDFGILDLQNFAAIRLGFFCKNNKKSSVLSWKICRNGIGHRSWDYSENAGWFYWTAFLVHNFFPPRVDYFFLLHGTAAELSILLILLHTAFVAERLIGLGVSIKIRVVFVTLITFLFGIFSQMRAGWDGTVPTPLAPVGLSAPKANNSH